MQTKTKIILGASLALVLLAGAAAVIIAGAAVYAFNEVTPGRMAAAEKSKADGIEYGKTTDQNGCMKKGFSLREPTDSFDIGNMYFVKECLGTSKTTANFCDGVPFILDRQWFDDQCQLAGHDTDSCKLAFIAKRNYCVMDGK